MMADIVKEIPFVNSKEYIRAWAEALMKELELEYKWVSEDKIEFKRFGGEGFAEIKGNVILMEIDLAWWAMDFKDEISDKIDARVAKEQL